MSLRNESIYYPTIDSLPVELILRIAQHCDIKTIAILSQTCKQFIQDIRHNADWIVNQHMQQALQENLLNVQQVFQIKRKYIKLLGTPHGLNALRDKIVPLSLITNPDSHQCADYDLYLKSIFSADGIEALKANVITLDEIFSLPYSYLPSILSVHGRDALANKVITVELLKQAAILGFNAIDLNRIFRTSLAKFGAEFKPISFYFLLKEGIVTFNQIMNMPDRSFLQHFCLNIDNYLLNYASDMHAVLQSKAINFETLHKFLLEEMALSSEKYTYLFKRHFREFYRNGLLNLEVARHLDKAMLEDFYYASCDYYILDPQQRKKYEKIWALCKAPDERSNMVALLQFYTKAGKAKRIFTFHWNIEKADQVDKIIGKSQSLSPLALLAEIKSCLKGMGDKCELKRIYSFLVMKYVANLMHKQSLQTQQSDEKRDSYRP